jgi:hypothetical protein
LPNGHAADVVAVALVAKITELPNSSADRRPGNVGTEMADYARFTIGTGGAQAPSFDGFRRRIRLTAALSALHAR